MQDRRRQAPRIVDQPQVGFYLTRMVKGGPLVPAQIICEHGMWQACINGQWHPPAADPLHAFGVSLVSMGQFIDQAEYDRRMKLKSIPGHPASTPHKPIDLSTAQPPEF